MIVDYLECKKCGECYDNEVNHIPDMCRCLSADWSAISVDDYVSWMHDKATRALSKEKGTKL